MKRHQMYAVGCLPIVALATWLVLRESGSSAVAATETTAAENSDQNRQSLAERCVKAAPTEVVARIACSRVALVRGDIPEAQRQEFVKAMLSELDLKLMAAKRVEVMAKHFTADELSALAEFYESPSGHSAWQKLDGYVEDMQGAMKSKMLEAESGARQTLGLPPKK